MNEFGKYRILLIEDEKDIRKMLSELLQSEGFDYVFTADSCAKALKTAYEQPIALFVLDIMLPDGDGFSLYEDIRHFSAAPVIFLTAKGRPEDKIKGLGLGADDYIVKPFLTGELVLRIKAVLRRTYGKATTDTKIMLADRYVDLEKAAVIKNDKEISLTAKEFLLIKKLYENKNKIVTNDALCMAAWGDGYYGYENTLPVHIRHLREKTELKPSSPVHIITVKGLGYRLVVKDEQDNI